VGKRKRKSKKKTTEKIMNDNDYEDDDSDNSENIFDNNFIIDKLPTDKKILSSLLIEVKNKLRQYKNLYLKEQ